MLRMLIITLAASWQGFSREEEAGIWKAHGVLSEGRAREYDFRLYKLIDVARTFEELDVVEERCSSSPR